LNHLAKASSSPGLRSIEKRRKERHPFHSLILISAPSDDSVKTQICQGVDISDSGISFQSDAELDFFNAIRVEYTDDNGDNFCRTARLLYRMNRKYYAYFIES